MRKQLAERLSSWKEVFWHKALVIAAALWGILGAWDLFKSEFLPEKYQSWTVVAKTPHMAFRTWLIFLLIALIVVLLEGVHEAIHKRNKEIKELRGTIANAARPARTTLNRDWPGDWKVAEQGFRRFEKSNVRADWFRDTSGPFEQWTITGAPDDMVKAVHALCVQAGRLLNVSPVSQSIAGDLRSQNKDADRWLYFLKSQYGIKDILTGTSLQNGKSYAAIAGSIPNLASASATACIECAAKCFT